MSTKSEKIVQEFDKFEALVTKARFIEQLDGCEQNILHVAKTEPETLRPQLAQALVDYDSMVLLREPFTAANGSVGSALINIMLMTQAHQEYHVIITAWDSYCEAVNDSQPALR